jgi:hypothetical protein
MRWHEGSIVAISETAAPIKQSRAQNFVQMRNALPLAGLFLALLVNAAWIGLLGYGILWMIR